MLQLRKLVKKVPQKTNKVHLKEPGGFGGVGITKLVNGHTEKII